ncbi:DUF6009 family protein [Anabaena catenula]|uniref:DUF6009 family protein n=1 Tax=Anabaena catenula TaxID=1296320 RepID=UPI001F5535A1|nr:DUF6009 family protein [Anabaena catenula]
MPNYYNIEHEKKIVWLDDPNNYPWVREQDRYFETRQGISKSHQSEIEVREKLIGYAELEDDTPPNSRNESPEYFYRRCFVIRHDDYKVYNKDDYYPSEAVDPLTVEPKTKGLSPRKKAQIAVRVPLYILRKLNNHIEKTGMSQTDIVVNALANYLNSASEIPIIQRIVTLEERVTMLEAK